MKYLPFLIFICSFSADAQPSVPSSASLNYSIPDTLQAIQFYTEIIVNKENEGYYGVTFSDGFLGLEKNGKDRRIIFKLWMDDANSKLLAKGLNVDISQPGKVQWKYNWQSNTAYKLLLTAIADSAGRSTFYTGYIYLPVEKQWKLLASFQQLNNGRYISKPAITIASKIKAKDISDRKLTVQQAWVQRANGTGKELQQANFSTNKIKGGTGTENGKIYIGGKSFITPPSENGKVIQTTVVAPRPVISVTNHVDSANQISIDKTLIFDALSKGKIDTTGSVQNVFYKILQEGTGDYVGPNDTVTVYYKGSLLADGSVFDQTKEKPATFPLNRLIKAWPIGLQKTKVGGKTRLIIPSGLAYSVRSRSKAIPPNSILIFDIEVLSAKKP